MKTTICSRHNDIISMCEDIIKQTNNAMIDGQNMENGLKEKNETIKQLEKEIARLEGEVEYWKDYAEQLHKALVLK